MNTVCKINKVDRVRREHFDFDKAWHSWIKFEGLKDYPVERFIGRKAAFFYFLQDTPARSSTF